MQSQESTSLKGSIGLLLTAQRGCIIVQSQILRQRRIYQNFSKMKAVNNKSACIFYRFYLFGAGSSPDLSKPRTRLPCWTLGPHPLNSFFGDGSCANDSGYWPCLNFSKHHRRYLLSCGVLWGVLGCLLGMRYKTNIPILSKSRLLLLNNWFQSSILHFSCRDLPNELKRVVVSVNLPLGSTTCLEAYVFIEVEKFLAKIVVLLILGHSIGWSLIRNYEEWKTTKQLF